jgi:hypothetical protein
MRTHPWLPPSRQLTAKVTRLQATGVLRELANVPGAALGARAAAWLALMRALPALLRTDPRLVLEAVARVDVLAVLQELSSNARVDPGRLERALMTLWLALARHPGLTAPLVLPGPFSQTVVDPRAPRLLALPDVRGLAATAEGAVVIGRAGHRRADELAGTALPAVGETVIVDERFDPPDAAVAARVQAALDVVAVVLPGGRLERVTIGIGDAAYGEARVGPAGDPAGLVASALAAFVRAASMLAPPLGPGGALVEHGRRVVPDALLARACGNAIALRWRGDAETAKADIARDLDELAVLADPTPAGLELVSALRDLVPTPPPPGERALVVNVDPDDFTYSFQFGQSVERRCVERGWRVDRIAIDPTDGRDLTWELGGPIPPPIADGTETLARSADDPCLAGALRRLASRRYSAVVANVRPRLFYDLLAAGLLRAPTLVWDRHLHDGLDAERERRGVAPSELQSLPITAWGLQGMTGRELNLSLVQAGVARGAGRPWPLDLEFFRSKVAPQPDRVFAGGDSGRDWPLFVEAIRGLPATVNLVTANAPASLPPNVQLERRLPLWRFRDALAAAAVTAIPLVSGKAAGVTVLPMAMALGVAIVATRTLWVEQYVSDGEEALLVPPDDPDAFRAALVRLMQDADLRARLVANARRRVAALCDLEAFTREMFATLGERR